MASGRPLAWAEGRAISPPRTFRVALPWVLRAEASDPQSDDRVPDSGYTYPTHPTFAPRTMDPPGRSDGASVMPGQNASLPEAMRWHLRLRAHAGATRCSARGARARTPAASIATDAARRSVTFTIAAAALGDAATLSGARVYVTTWDYDGGYRALARDPAPYTVGGGDAARDPKVMDASAVIRLP